MNWEVLYHPLIVKDDLPKIPRNIQKRIKKAIEIRIFTNPVFAGIPLARDLKGYRKMRVGDYRIIYKLGKGVVLILMIGHRKEVYRRVLTRTYPLP